VILRRFLDDNRDKLEAFQPVLFSSPAEPVGTTFGPMLAA
jgi:hypothetical protein